MRFCVGLALNSFLEIPIAVCLKIDKFLVWAGPEHLPLNLIYILIENWWDSGMGWFWTVVSKFLLHFNWKLMRFWLGLAQAVSLKFLLHANWKLVDSGLGCPWAVSSKFLLHSNWKLMRFWLGLALSNFLEFLLHSNWKRMRSWLGLALNSFLIIPMTFWLKLDEILAWAGPEQFPLNSN